MNYKRWRFPRMHNGRFKHHGAKSVKTLWHLICFGARYLALRPEKDDHELRAWLNVPSDEAARQPVFGTDPYIMWIGHSTFLIRIGNKTILTDPIFDSFSCFLNFERLMPPGVAIENLPPIDVVLISHNHPDHMDKKTLLFLKKQHNPLFLIPYGNGEWFDRRGFSHVREFSWWDTLTSGDLTCTFLPAIHWSQRGLVDHNRSMWGGWMIEGYDEHRHTRLFFAGDTAYGEHFKVIAEAYPRIDLALLPIGPCDPNKLNKEAHLNGEEVGRAFLDLNADCLVPMHWGTYRLEAEPPLVPIKRLVAWWKEQAHLLKDKSLLSLRIGELRALAPQLKIEAARRTVQLFHAL